jgi:predicted DNA-binding transcriptional regulator YafY
MRAERLLRTVILLQSRGQMTAAELAGELEVSPRTIQRDMEALSGSGVPVYATRGVGGGWALHEGYRTSLTGLTSAEALAIVVGRPPGILAGLGLDDPGEAAVLKLLAAVSQSARDRAEHARQRVHVDIAPWGWSESSMEEREALLPQLQRAVWDDRTVRIRYAASDTFFEVEPLGLVAKGSTWYLVARNNGRFRTYRVTRIHDLAVTDRSFERPNDFDLASHWQSASARYADQLPNYPVQLRARGDATRRVGWMQGRDKQISSPDHNGWVTIDIDLEDEDNALTVVGMLGADVEIVSPKKLRRAAVELARRFAMTNA